MTSVSHMPILLLASLFTSFSLTAACLFFFFHPQIHIKFKFKFMGLQNQLTDVSSDSLPIFLLATIAAAVSHLRSLILTVLHSLHISTNRHSDDVTSVILNRISSYKYTSDPADSDTDCIVCLNRFNDGEHVRKLPCKHVFHKECFDGWLEHLNFNCPLCRSPMVVDERVEVTRRRLTDDVIDWFAVRG